MIMIGDSEDSGSMSFVRMSSVSMSSASMILIADAGSVKRGNFADTTLIAGENSITGVILTAESGSEVASSMIMSAGKIVDGVEDAIKKKVG